MDDVKRMVRDGYDLMGGSYLAWKDKDHPLVAKQLESLVSGLPPDASALDLGCGAGLPGTAFLVQQAYVIGVDISPAQIALAEQLVPGATYVCEDVAALDFPSGSFDAVLALWSLCHLPREDQPQMLSGIFDWLRPGGRFLSNWSVRDWEGQESNWNNWGAPMFWSHYDAEHNVRMIKAAGFVVNTEKQIATDGETWLWVLASRPL